MRHPYFWDYPPHRRRVLTATAGSCLAGLLIAGAGQLHWPAPTDPAKPTLLAERASQNPEPTRKSDDESQSPGSDDSSGSADGSDGKDSDHRGTSGGSGSSSGAAGGSAAETSPGSASSPAAGSVLPPVAGPLPGVGQPGDGPLEKPGVGGGSAAAPVPPPGPTSGAALPAPAIPAPSWGPGTASSAASSGGSSESGSRRIGRGARTDSTADTPPQATVDRAARQQRIRRALPPGFVPTAPASPPAVSQPTGALDTDSSTTPPGPGGSAVSVPATSPALTQTVPPVAGGSSSWPGAQPGAALTPVACPAGVTVAGATCYQSQASSVSPASPSAPAVAAAAPEVGSSTAPAMSLPAAAPTRSAASDAPINVNGHGCQLSDQVRYHATGNWWGDLMSWAMGQAQQCAQNMGGSGGWNSDTASGGSSSSSGPSKKSHRKASDK